VIRFRRVVVRVEGLSVSPAWARALAEEALALAEAGGIVRGRAGSVRVRVVASTLDDRALPERIGRAVSAAIAERVAPNSAGRDGSGASGSRRPPDPAGYEREGW
jgi:hypothetical protein